MLQYQTEPTKLEDFKKKVTDYFSWFALAHHSALRPHYAKGEVLGKGKVEPWIAKTTPHCLVAGAYADMLIDELRNTGLPEYQIAPAEKKVIVDAMILHDWRKKQEILAIDMARKNNNLTYETLTQIKELDAAELRAMGFHEDVIVLTGANVPHSEYGPSSLAEQIIWYVDAMLSITEAVPIKQRFDDLDRGWTGEAEDPQRAARSKAFSELFKHKYADKPLFDIQRIIADRLNRLFAIALGYEGNPNDLPLFLKHKLTERIAQFCR